MKACGPLCKLLVIANQFWQKFWKKKIPVKFAHDIYNFYKNILSITSVSECRQTDRQTDNQRENSPEPRSAIIPQNDLRETALTLKIPTGKDKMSWCAHKVFWHWPQNQMGANLPTHVQRNSRHHVTKCCEIFFSFLTFCPRLFMLHALQPQKKNFGGWGGGGGGFGVDEAFQIFHIFFTLKVKMPYRIFRCEIV